MVAGCDPLRLYIYKEGLGRFATETYENINNDNIENMFMHLTNYAINKNNPNFQFNKSDKNMNQGHKRSLTSVIETLKNLGHNTAQMWDDIKKLTIKTLCSV